MTCEVLKLDKSNEINNLQPLNIKCISLTCEVLKLDRFNECKDEQYSNILFIDVTWEVLKLDKSISIILEHKLNIYWQLIIFSSQIK